MNAELKRLHSPDIFNLESYHPEDPRKFVFLLQIMVGPEGVKGEESFDVEVCSPMWLEENVSLDSVEVGRKLINMKRYSYVTLLAAIRDFLSECSGENWSEIAQKVSRLGNWEFDGYRM